MAATTVTIDLEDLIRQTKADALEEHRRRVVRSMPPGLVDRATVIADLEDWASRIREGRDR